MEKILSLEESTVVNSSGKNERQFTTIIEDAKGERNHFTISENHMNFKRIENEINKFIENEIDNKDLARFILENSSTEKQIQEYFETINATLDSNLSFNGDKMSINNIELPHFIYEVIVKIMGDVTKDLLHYNRDWIALSNFIEKIASCKKTEEEKSCILNLLQDHYSRGGFFKLSPGGNIIHLNTKYLDVHENSNVALGTNTEFNAIFNNEVRSLITVSFENLIPNKNTLLVDSGLLLFEKMIPDNNCLLAMLKSNQLVISTINDSFEKYYLYERELLQNFTVDDYDEIDVSMINSGDIIGINSDLMMLYVLDIESNGDMIALSLNGIREESYNIYDFTDVRRYYSDYSLEQYFRDNFDEKSIASFKLKNAIHNGEPMLSMIFSIGKIGVNGLVGKQVDGYLNNNLEISYNEIEEVY